MVKTGARKLGFINCCSPTDSHTSVQEGTSRVQRRVRQTKGSYTRVQPGLVQEFPNSTICRRPEGTS